MKEQVWFVKVKRPWASPKRFMDAVQSFGLGSEVTRVDANANSRTEMTVYASFEGMQLLREKAELRYAVMVEGDLQTIGIRCYGPEDEIGFIFILNCFLEEYLLQDDVARTHVVEKGHHIEIMCTRHCAEFISGLIGNRLLCTKVAC